MQPTDPTISDPPADDTAALLNHLQTHDAFCPLCKYNLRHLTEPRCPECGRALQLTVGLTEPHLRLLVLTLVALCISAGCGVPSLCVIIDEMRIRGWDLPRFFNLYIAFIIYGSIASLVPATLCIALYRRFLRARTQIQMYLAIMAIIWDVALLIVFLGVIFGHWR